MRLRMARLTRDGSQGGSNAKSAIKSNPRIKKFRGTRSLRGAGARKRESGGVKGGNRAGKVGKRSAAISKGGRRAGLVKRERKKRHFLWETLIVVTLCRRDRESPRFDTRLDSNETCTDLALLIRAEEIEERLRKVRGVSTIYLATVNLYT